MPKHKALTIVSLLQHVTQMKNKTKILSVDTKKNCVKLCDHPRNVCMFIFVKMLGVIMTKSEMKSAVGGSWSSPKLRVQWYVQHRLEVPSPVWRSRKRIDHLYWVDSTGAAYIPPPPSTWQKCVNVWTRCCETKIPADYTTWK